LYGVGAGLFNLFTSFKAVVGSKGRASPAPKACGTDYFDRQVSRTLAKQGADITDNILNINLNRNQAR